MQDLLDFDRFLMEKEEEAIPVKVLGRVYRVKPEIPAMVPLLMARSEEMDDGDATRLVLRAADALFGPGAMDEMAAGGLGAGELAELVRMVFERIQMNMEEGDVPDDAGKRRKSAGKA